MIHGRFKSRSLPSDSFSLFFFYCFETGEAKKGEVEEKRDRSRKVTKREEIKIREVKNRSQRREGGKEKDEEGSKQRDKTEEQRRDGRREWG